MPSQFDLLLRDLATAEQRRDRDRAATKSIRSSLAELRVLAKAQAHLVRAQTALVADTEQARLRHQVARGTAILSSLVANGRLSALDTARLQAGLHHMAETLR